MVYRGQRYRKVGEDGVWEVLGPRKNPDREGEWFLSKVDGGSIEAVHERDLEHRNLWIPIRDD